MEPVEVDHCAAVVEKLPRQYPAQFCRGTHREQPSRMHHDNLLAMMNRDIDCGTHRPTHPATYRAEACARSYDPAQEPRSLLL
jgi:hypothetical protein